MTDQPRDPALPEEDPSRAAPPLLPPYQPPRASTGRSDPAADPALRARALKKLEAEKGFRIHLTVYLAVIGLLTAIWLATGLGNGLGYYWPIWPALGWGLGLVLHRASLGWDKEPTEEEVDAEARRLAQRGTPRRDAIED
ncbi:2TM domain-containing protein [Ornithinimicrobium cerasi]|uniref:2TM domain-containing protein n=1 Tax=Ornithinimicrobium cerasi TaxID=2248773 RepID=UPI000F008860|nr:2TM domain-containing protein [Ornithinimicrobium cerasi]